MELYFLRHDIAAERGDPKYKDDSLRPLIPQGREKMHRAALGMQALGLKFDSILSSPYLRARQTAEMVAQVYKLKNNTIHLTDTLLPPASIKKLLQEIHQHFPKSKNILLVGHEPHFTEMISDLLQSDQPLNIDLKKGGLCCLKIRQDLNQPNAELLWLLTPLQLELMSH